EKGAVREIRCEISNRREPRFLPESLFSPAGCQPQRRPAGRLGLSRPASTPPLPLPQRGTIGTPRGTGKEAAPPPVCDDIWP
ncbi:hypothetical protein P7K49_038298, partial [Saguinus oedipus]